MKMNKILLILAITLSCPLFLLSKVQPGKWKTITIDIARDGDANNRGEFEAAKQAFLNISLKGNAKEAADWIEKTWKADFGLEATAGDKDNPAPGTLMSLPRYPNMDKNQIHNSAVDLFEKTEIANFLHGENFTYTVPAKL